MHESPPTPRSLPLIPVVIAVIVVGFAIGAGVSLLGHRNTSPTPGPTVAALPSESPIPETPAPTRAPVALRTSSPERSASPEVTPSIAPGATPSPAPIVTPLSSRIQTAPPVAPARSAAPRVAVARTPLPLAPPAPPRTIAPTPAPEPTDVADSDFAHVAAAVARAYLNAVARGDDASARASLSGGSNGDLPEKAFAGPDMHIAHVEAHGSSGTALVDVDIDTPQGPVFEQFAVKQTSTGAALITSHTFIKR